MGTLFLLLMVGGAGICLANPEVITNHLSHWVRDELLVEKEDERKEKEDNDDDTGQNKQTTWISL